jgi:bacillopeptidase F
MKSMSMINGTGRALTLLLVGGVVSTFLTVSPATAETIVYSQGFESDNGGFTHTGTQDQWEWGTPDPTFTAGPGAAHAGAKCWGTDLDAHVPYNSDSYLTSPAIALPALGANEVARVRFFAWIAVDEMHDRGEFQVSSDGSTWETKAELFHVMLSGWSDYYFDVSDYAGGNIYLRFRCRADGTDYFYISSYNMAGLYIDDIAIMITPAPAIETTVTLEA